MGCIEKLRIFFIFKKNSIQLSPFTMEDENNDSVHDIAHHVELETYDEEQCCLCTLPICDVQNQKQNVGAFLLPLLDAVLYHAEGIIEENSVCDVTEPNIGFEAAFTFNPVERVYSAGLDGYEYNDFEESSFEPYTLHLTDFIRFYQLVFLDYSQAELYQVELRAIKGAFDDLEESMTSHIYPRLPGSRANYLEFYPCLVSYYRERNLSQSGIVSVKTKLLISNLAKFILRWSIAYLPQIVFIWITRYELWEHDLDEKAMSVLHKIVKVKFGTHALSEQNFLTQNPDIAGCFKNYFQSRCVFFETQWDHIDINTSARNQFWNDGHECISFHETTRDKSARLPSISFKFFT
jgi:hypothetical protein